MKKTKIFIVSALLAALFSCRVQDSNLAARIEGWGNDTILVMTTTQDTYEDEVDTVYAVNGVFEYSLPDDSTAYWEVRFYRTKDHYAPEREWYMPSSREIVVTIQPGDRLRLNGRIRECVLHYRVEGSPLAADQSDFRERILPYLLKKDSIYLARVDRLRAGLPPDYEQIRLESDSIRAVIREQEMAFAAVHPDREAAGYYSAGYVHPLGDDFYACYDLLSPAVKSGYFKPRLDARIEVIARIRAKAERKKELIPGKPAPDFTLPDLSGVPFTLSEYDTGKYIVLDFWGSWCGPCLAEMPAMKALYAKHRDRLEIIGIACRDTESSWKKALDKLRLPWLQVLDGMVSAETGARTRYVVDAFPTKIILSPQKNIIGTYIGEAPDFYKKLDELLK